MVFIFLALKLSEGACLIQVVILHNISTSALAVNAHADGITRSRVDAKIFLVLVLTNVADVTV
jgi:hypothetical protein